MKSLKMEKIDIVEFYKRISRIIEDYREQRMTHSMAIAKIDEVNQLAKDNNINISFDSSELLNVSQFDDERSYVEDDYEYSDDSSY